MVSDGLRPTLLREQARRIVLDGLLPLPNLDRVDPILLADLVERLDALKASRPTFALNSGLWVFRFRFSLIFTVLGLSGTA